MKKFLKKANRGLILSSVVLVILVTYIIADYVSFQSQKDTINQVINNYYDEIYKTNTDSDGLSDSHHNKVKDIINTYWCDADSSLQWATNKSTMMEFASDIFTDQETVYDISDVDFKIRKIKIKKIGPGYASVSLTYTANITGMSNSCVLTPSNYRILSDYEDDYYGYEDDASKNPEDASTEQPKKGTLSYTADDVTIELHREDGVWKICAINAYESSSSFDYINE